MEYTVVRFCEMTRGTRSIFEKERSITADRFYFENAIFNRVVQHCARNPRHPKEAVIFDLCLVIEEQQKKMEELILNRPISHRTRNNEAERY